MGRCEQGVPQASVLGPLLIVIYVNDLLESISGFSLSYADDLKLVGSWKPPRCKSPGIQNDLDIIINWSKIWSSDFNLLKCKSMSIGRKD
ncbi:unnamed protein product [Brachionus calyciflorus]|uniref:Reverse transcriptase domain-containing protein n=1 Tax=Brachionus calyciflorus TaxID=104777 RepID=A0A813ZU29_9BILA|nr:unnamed protein product [Brachionus calyciflorus]